MRSLHLHLDLLRRSRGLSTAEIQRRFVRRGVSLNGSTVSRWFVDRPDACTPNPGQLQLLLDILEATDAERIETLRIAGAALVEAEQARSPAA